MKRLLAGAAFLGIACCVMATPEGRRMLDRAREWCDGMMDTWRAAGSAPAVETVEHALEAPHPETAMAAAFEEAVTAADA